MGKKMDAPIRGACGQTSACQGDSAVHYKIGKAAEGAR
jgi:hypothetical protein